MKLVLEELCNDGACSRGEDTHWHPFDVESLLSDGVGEYSIVVRVRAIRKRKRAERRTL